VVRVRILAETQKRHSFRNNAMIHLVMRSSKDLMKRVNLFLEQVQMVRTSYSDCLQVGRIVECRRLTEWGLRPTPSTSTALRVNFLPLRWRSKKKVQLIIICNYNIINNIILSCSSRFSSNYNCINYVFCCSV